MKCLVVIYLAFGVWVFVNCGVIKKDNGEPATEGSGQEIKNNTGKPSLAKISR